MTYNYQYPHMAVTVDVVLFDSSSAKPSILLIKRANNPYKDHWALPGGYVDMKEKIEAAAARELSEETGAKIKHIEFLGYFDDINRDPRERTLSLAFWAKTQRHQQSIAAADDAKDAQWFAISELPELAFDHQAIIDIAIRKFNNLR